MTKPQNPWISHLMNTRSNLPNTTSLKKAMQIAKKTYKKTTNTLSKPFFKKSRKVARRKSSRGRGSRKSRKFFGGDGENVMGPKSIGGGDAQLNTPKMEGGNPNPIPAPK